MNVEKSSPGPTQETEKSTKILREFKESNFLDLDPSLDHGFKLVEKWEISLTTIIDKLRDEREERATIRLFDRGNKHEINEYKIEIMNESDPFYHLSSSIDKQAFARYKTSERLQGNFETFRLFIKQLFTSLEEGSEKIKGTMKIHKNGMGTLNFSEKLDFRTVSILNLNFVPSNDLFIRKSITFRFNMMRVRYNFLERKINETIAAIKEKNPLLLTYLKKNLNFVPNYD